MAQMSMPGTFDYLQRHRLLAALILFVVLSSLVRTYIPPAICHDGTDPFEHVRIVSDKHIPTDLCAGHGGLTLNWVRYGGEVAAIVLAIAFWTSLGRRKKHLTGRT